MSMRDVATLANRRWAQRGEPQGDSETDWLQAEWEIEHLMPFIVDACPNEVHERLLRECSEYRSHVKAKTKAIVILAVLDGGVEFCRDCYWRFRVAHESNGIPLHLKVQKKTHAFYRLCATVFELYDLEVLGGKPGNSEERFLNAEPTALQLYEDTCMALGDMSDRRALVGAISACLYLRRSLARHNAEHALAWTQQLHPRIVVSTSVQEAIKCLPIGWRDDVVISEDCLEALTPDCAALLMAAGGRLARKRIEEVNHEAQHELSEIAA